MPAPALAAPVALRHRRRVAPWLAGALSALGFIALLLVVGMLGAVFGLQPAELGDYRPSALARAQIPPLYLRLYEQAGRRYGIDPWVLAAIGAIETNHGRARLPGVRNGVNAYGCCAGPMQFQIAPYPGRIRAGTSNRSTWGTYGVDGNDDEWKDVYDPADAIPAAARYLVANGAPDDYERAIFAYNRAGWYVADVLAKAETYRGATDGPADVPGGGGARAVLRAADELDVMDVPYVYGGGHVQPAVPNPGLDCSSSVSWVLQHAGIAAPTMTSTLLMNWGDPGPGKTVTIYANRVHTFMRIGNRYWGTSAFGHIGAGTGPHWFTRQPSASYLATFVRRHPPGL